MRQVLNLLMAVIVGLVNVVLGVVALVEGALRTAMTQAGIGAQLQRPVLIVVAVLLIVAALRLLGRALGLLVVVFLVLLLLDLLAPGLSHVRPVHV